MPLYRRPESPVWYIDLRHPRGGRLRRSTRTTDRAAAQRQHDELAARLWHVKQTGRQFSDALLAWTTARPRGPSDIRALRLIRARYKDRPLLDVTAQSLLDTFGDCGPSTYNRLANILRAALNMAEARGWIERAPVLERRPEPPPRERFLTGSEWQRLRAELPDHLRPMADFAIATGLRWSNVAGLEWERVDLKRKVAWIPARQAKGRKGISVPLSAAALAALRATGKARTGPVFTYRGNTLGSPKTAFRKALARAKLDGVTWHTLRHTWASWHAMAGTPLDVLQILGGWASRDMLERYAHLAPSYVAQFAGNARPAGHKAGHTRARKAA